MEICTPTGAIPTPQFHSARFRLAHVGRSVGAFLCSSADFSRAFSSRCYCARRARARACFTLSLYSLPCGSPISVTRFSQRPRSGRPFLFLAGEVVRYLGTPENGRLQLG